ncbi:AMP-dependent synthetase/ligase [Desulfopila inferna]|uniref:AMP-dependent synthetase/ligase n=1 Tax=Desulfopila inferna TaxID=468528 RepID=UPI001963771B|nr:long-chain fatty acid--CoA ligase [Desulfopila inferna]MBM9603380.1 long-chain fatty acid--CoA ligase [Desulfopila inferna]
MTEQHQATYREHTPEREEPVTLFEMLLNSCDKYRDNTAYIYRMGEEEISVTYAKLLEDVLLLSRAFEKRGLGKDDKVMFLSDNRYAWIVTDLAIMSLGAVTVPRGSDTPTQELSFIIENSNANHLVIESDTLLEKHKEFIKGCRQIKTIFVMTSPEKHKLFSNTYSYNDLLSDRTICDHDMEMFRQRGEKIHPENLLTLIYTSGTTGLPKGVQLSHGNVMHNIKYIPEIIELVPEDRWLSILPSWHIFERTAEYSALCMGTCLVYSSVKTFAQDLEHYQPTLVATVPRVWESLYSKVELAIRKKGKAAQAIFNTLVLISSKYQRNLRQVHGHLPQFQQRNPVSRMYTKMVALIKVILLFPLYLVARKKLSLVQQRFGGKLRLAISGGGTLAGYLEEWIDAVGIRIVNAYGMTECSPAIAGRGLNCPVYGTLGPAVPETDLRIVSEQGEILGPGAEGLIEVRGPQVTAGYFDNEEENRKSFTEDGFFRTGDLGMLTVGGELVITGRAKEIIVLASGENIDPSRIENAITIFPFIQDAVLVGQDKKGLGALLVPNMEELREYISKKISGLKNEEKDLTTDTKVLDHVKSEMNRLLLPKQGFKPHEKLQGIVFLDREFTLGEELTNTLKKKRHVIERKYKALIDTLLR